MSIHSISVVIKGRIITTGRVEEGSNTFLEYAHTLWTKAHGDPRQTMSSRSAKHEGKVAPGDYIWNFHFPFPAAAVDPNMSAEGRYLRAPQSFSESRTPASIQYDLILRLGRGALRLNRIITVPIIYTPKIIPDSPSFLRGLAYREGNPLPGPLEDPDGWHTLDPVVAPIKPPRTQDLVDVECQLSLAKPASLAQF
ncbi:hypothetical protein H0H81_010965 [Sphagnurus paluster]|uniref:Arrestin-like N-terminal domain-containing protein n=1 Tax=Sphagnurus paluster TaxID=117069 RepID=A0A9P7FNR4_9AGAR|nr:hypothetical protein H0H81_010965 [Sphagnurus paluster]